MKAPPWGGNRYGREWRADPVQGARARGLRRCERAVRPGIIDGIRTALADMRQRTFLAGRTGAGGERARLKGRGITTACAPPWGGKRPAAHLLRIHALAGAPAGPGRAGRVIEPGSDRGRRGSWNGHVRSRRVCAVRHHVKLRRRRIACGVFFCAAAGRGLTSYFWTSCP